MVGRVKSKISSALRTEVEKNFGTLGRLAFNKLSGTGGGDVTKEVKQTIRATQESGEFVQYTLAQATKNVTSNYRKATSAITKLDDRIVDKLEDMADIFDRMAYMSKGMGGAGGGGSLGIIGGMGGRNRDQAPNPNDPGWLDWLLNHAGEIGLGGLAGVKGLGKTKFGPRTARARAKSPFSRAGPRVKPRFGSSFSTQTKAGTRPRVGPPTATTNATRAEAKAAGAGVKATGKGLGLIKGLGKVIPGLAGIVAGGVDYYETGSVLHALIVGAGAQIGQVVGGAGGGAVGAVPGAIAGEIAGSIYGGTKASQLADWLLGTKQQDKQADAKKVEGTTEAATGQDLIFEASQEILFDIQKEIVFDADRVEWPGDVPKGGGDGQGQGQGQGQGATPVQPPSAGSNIPLGGNVPGDGGAGTVPGIAESSGFFGGLLDKAKNLLGLGGNKGGGQTPDGKAAPQGTPQGPTKDGPPLGATQPQGPTKEGPPVGASPQGTAPAQKPATPVPSPNPSGKPPTAPTPEPAPHPRVSSLQGLTKLAMADTGTMSDAIPIGAKSKTKKQPKFTGDEEAPKAAKPKDPRDDDGTYSERQRHAQQEIEQAQKEAELKWRHEQNRRMLGQPGRERHNQVLRHFNDWGFSEGEGHNPRPPDPRAPYTGKLIPGQAFPGVMEDESYNRWFGQHFEYKDGQGHWESNDPPKSLEEHEKRMEDTQKREDKPRIPRGTDPQQINYQPSGSDLTPPARGGDRASATESQGSGTTGGGRRVDAGANRVNFTEQTGSRTV